MDRTELIALRAQVLATLRRVEMALGPEKPKDPEQTGGHRALTVDLEKDSLEDDRRSLEKERREFNEARIRSLKFAQTQMATRRNDILWKVGLVLIALLAAFLFRKLGIQ